MDINSAFNNTNRTIKRDSTGPSQVSNLALLTRSTTWIAISWSASTDAGTGVREYLVWKNGVNVANTTNATTTYNATGLTQGTFYSFVVGAVDAISNFGTNSTAASIPTIDTTAPVVTLNAPPNNEWNQSSLIYFYFVAYDTGATSGDLHHCELHGNFTGLWANSSATINAVNNNTQYSAFNYTLSDGVYAWNVMCYDNNTAQYRNNASAAADRIVKIDSTPPTISLNSPPDNTWNKTLTQQFRYTPVDSNFKNCSLWTNDTGSWARDQWNSTAVTSGTQNTFSKVFASDGIYLWNVQCYDFINIGWAAANWTVKIDTIPPSAPANLTNITGNTWINISWDDLNTLPTAEYSNTTSGLVGLWHFNEGTGTTAYDESVFKNNGTLYGTNILWNTSGKYGSALQLNSSGTGQSSVNVSNSNSFNIINNVTLEAWVYLQAASVQYGIIQKPNNNTNSISFRLVTLATTGNFYGSVLFADGTYSSAQTPNPPTLNTWYHVVYIYDGNNSKIYQDGILQTTSSAVSKTINSSTDPLVIGGLPPSNELIGMLDEVAVYNRSLTATEIAVHALGSAISGSPISKYLIYRNGTNIGNTTALSYNDTGLFPLTEYQYKVGAMDTANNFGNNATLNVNTTVIYSLTVSLPTGTPKYKINATSQTGTFQPVNQTNVTPIYALNLTGDNSTVYIKLNDTLNSCMSVYFMPNATWDVSQSWNISTTWVPLFNMTTYQNRSLWSWAIYNNCTPGTTFNRQFKFGLNYTG